MQSADDWRRRAREKEQAAKVLATDRKTARDGYVQAGFAVEYALKAVIQKRHRFNRWPDKNERPDLYVHNLRPLIVAAGIDPQALSPELRKNLSVVSNWDRGHDYAAERMPRKVVRDMIECAFGEDGVMTWLMTL